MMPATAHARTYSPASANCGAMTKAMSGAASRESAISAARQRTACLAVAWGVHKTVEVLGEVFEVSFPPAAPERRLLDDVAVRLADVVADLRIADWDDMSAGARREMEAITTQWLDLREEHLSDLWAQAPGDDCNPSLSPAGWSAWIGALTMLVHDVCAVQGRNSRDAWSKLRTGLERLWWPWVEGCGHCHDMVRMTGLYCAMAGVLPPLGGKAGR
ncbi:hypothetical protein [Nitratidesulfovibrio liaohensis]|uniref:Uncharacterized protein n=1 Tax=Nitratidesulfovibrio liaohensis TaxID=2604158 RepID=A0ABY9QXW0_9BACT|nr:hypothetical protein [Nitratidesulfovibrio liaohensis]WMW64370.1 hypothetical protein KPS_002382 [Nitratidesulfovibrio liaohensis]